LEKGKTIKRRRAVTLIEIASPKWLNLAGLVFGMAGVVAIFVWGPPMPDLDDDPSLVIGAPFKPTTKFEDGTTGQAIIDAAARRGRLKRVHSLMSRVGLGLIGCGFALQFIATMLEPSP
jgi:hypothetical protein